MKTGFPRSHARAFTLVELSAVIVVVCITGSIMLPALVRAKQRSAQAACQLHLKKVGSALQLYTKAHGGYLPGPTVPEVRAGYDSGSQHEFAWFLAEALGLPKPSTNQVNVPVLVCPASEGFENDEGFPISYLLNDDVDPEKGSCIRPFGCPGDPSAQPLRIAELSRFGSPATIGAMTDADKGNVNPRAACWNELPYTPVHGRKRNRLMFDWHVESKAW